LTCFAALLFLGCVGKGSKPGPAFADPRIQQIRRSQPKLGTFVTITAFGLDRAALLAAMDAAFAEFDRVDELMSIHRADSELSALNRAAGQGEVAVSEDLFQVLQAAQSIHQRSGGAFDVTIRPVADLWGFIWKVHRLPTEAELRSALAKVGFEKVILNPQTLGVRITEPGVSIDLGGIAKGYAVDRAVERLKSMGVSSAMVKAGGDLRVLGLPPGEDHWQVQLEDPDKRGRRMALRMKSGALSTSGDYENFFDVEGRRFSHILNPRDGMPVEGVAACTVLAPTCMESDALATTFFILGEDQASRRYGRQYPALFVLRTSAGLKLNPEAFDFPPLTRAKAGEGER